MTSLSTTDTPAPLTTTTPTNNTQRHASVVHFENNGASFSCVFEHLRQLDAPLAAALRKPDLLINSTW